MTVTRATLELSIAELTVLMSLPNAVEEDFQQWFERHPVAFEVLGYVRGIPHPELSLDATTPMFPDFIAQRPDGLWEVVELKRPDTQVLRNPERRTVFYSDMGTYVAQCQEYSDRCTQAQVVNLLREKHGIEMNAQPSCILVAGRSAGTDRLKVHDLLKRSTTKISHHTYDDVLDALERHYISNYLGEVGGRGVSVYATILLTEPHSEAGQCLFDLGEAPSRNRITVSRSGLSQLTVSVIDNDGMQSSQDINLLRHCNGVGFVCGIHVTHAMDTALVLVEVNGSYVAEHRLVYGDIVLSHPLPLVVGADIHGLRCASMLFGMFLTRDPALTPLERAQLREYMFEKAAPQLQTPPDLSTPRGLRFANTQFMYTEGHPLLDATHPRSTNLVQRDDDNRPTFAG